MEIKKDIMQTLPLAINNSKVFESKSSSTTYVQREDLERKVKDKLLRNDLGYTIVYGPKGAGKSELVKYSAIGLQGVIKLTVTSAHTKDEVVSALLKQLMGVNTEKIDAAQLLGAIKKCPHKPTIIFDVEGVSSANIQSIRSLAKFLASSCACVIILPEANAILDFGKDKDREEYLYINEMTREQGAQLLEKLGAKLTQRELDFVFHNIGTRPAMLERLAHDVPSKMSLEQFVAHVGPAR